MPSTSWARSCRLLGRSGGGESCGRSARAALLGLVALACAATLEAQAISFQRIDVAAFPEITVYFTATDEAGDSILGLSKTDLEVTFDRQPQRVVALESALAGGESLAVALLFDRSGSMKGSLEETKVAAMNFLDRLSIGDQAAILSFDDSVTVAARLGAVEESTRQAVAGLTPGRDTALHDAIAVAVELLGETAVQRRAIIVLSDGKDTSSAIDAAAAARLATDAGVPIFPIALATNLDEENLAQLATSTGGGLFHAAEPRELLEIYRQIGERLENQYRVRIEAAFEADEAWHDLRVGYRDPVLGDLFAERGFVASRGPGVSRQTLRSFEREVVRQDLLTVVLLGAAAGLAVGLLLLAVIRLATGSLSLLLPVALVVCATLLGAIVGALVGGLR